MDADVAIPTCQARRNHGYKGGTSIWGIITSCFLIAFVNCPAGKAICLVLKPGQKPTAEDVTGPGVGVGDPDIGILLNGCVV